ncbi:MAG: TIGR02206 family membrane protein [Gammaproteobacteria bacterium]|nr:TIGR02206 family membrane protein [Gammaproteobacteria bacterium]
MATGSHFQLLSAPHVAALCLVFLVPVLLSVAARRGGERVTTVICVTFAAVMFANEAGHWVYRLLDAGVDEFVRRHLPLHICGIAVLALVVTLVFRNRYTFEIVYFWGLAGTFNALLTPQLEVGFPEYRFFQYFIGHGGIVAGALFAVWGLRMRPTLASLARAFGLLLLLTITLLVVNPLLGSNYMFLQQPPDSASPFFFAPWPYYIPVLAGIGLLFFGVLLAPFAIADRWRRRRGR